MATINAASAATADVQAAIDIAAVGDTVVIPATSGVLNWTTGVSCSKGITIQGAGIGSTIIGDTLTNRSHSLFGIGHQDTGSVFRLTGIEMRGTGLSGLQFGYVTIYATNRLSGNSQWRIDNCRWQDINGRPGYFWAIAGLIDHCEISTSGTQSGFVSDGRSGAEGSNEKGHRTWANPPQAGTADEGIFIEDCNFAYTGSVRRAITDCFCGGKFVTRRNTLTNCCVENHGTESTGIFRGGRWLCSLDNTFNATAGSGEYCVLIRSGSGIVRGNVANGTYSGFLRMANYRESTAFSPWGGATGANQCDSNDPTIYGTGTVTTASADGAGGRTISDSSQSWISNQWVGYHIRNTTTGVGSYVVSNTATQVTYAGTIGGAFVNPTWAVGDTFEFRKILQALDQPGVGAGDLLVGGANTPATLPTNPSTSPGDIWPRQAIEPIYHWNNTGSVTGVSNSGQYTIQSGVHYKNEAAPSYTEFTYPHPLTGSLSSPSFLAQPSNLTVTAGTTATFTCAATGNPAPTYQWRKNGSNISGATSASLVITNAQDADEGTYSCVATNSQGSATSTGATLTVNASADTTPPTPNPSTIASATVNSSSQITVVADTAVDAVSSPVEYNHAINGTYQGWQISATRIFSGLTPATTYSFRVKSRDAAGNETTQSDALDRTTDAASSAASPLGNRGSRTFAVGIL